MRAMAFQAGKAALWSVIGLSSGETSIVRVEARDGSTPKVQLQVSAEALPRILVPVSPRRIIFIMRFTKMHGIGNDYVYVNGFAEALADPADIARKVSDRHFGIGSDGLILILPSDKADVRMRMFNADGSESEMCGNGVRCVAKYAFDHGLTRSNPMKVETGRGVLSLALETGADKKVRQVTVNMGEPILEAAKIPVEFPRPIGAERIIDFPLGKYIPFDDQARDHWLEAAMPIAA